MKLSSYFLITVITVVLVAMIISNTIDTPRSGKEDMALYITAIDEALLRQFVEKTVDLKNRDAWHKPELFAEIEGMCAEWKPLADRWKAHKISESIGKLCDLHEVRIVHRKTTEMTQ